MINPVAPRHDSGVGVDSSHDAGGIPRGGPAAEAPRPVAFEVAIAIVGVVLAAGALAANQRWLDRHFLPSFFLPRPWYVAIEAAVRVSVALIGVLLAVVARARIARAIARTSAYASGVVLAAALALAAGEFVLQRVLLRPTEWLSSQEEPLRVTHSRLGWVLAPARTGHAVAGGRPIDYAIDAAGYRVPSVAAPVDPDRETIVFAGESVMFGEGLPWDDSIPAQVGTILGHTRSIQIANLAVHGYSSDQVYLRLQQELPRFRNPAAVVTLFMTALFGRNLDRDRPHLGAGLLWLPAEGSSRLAALAHLLVPYRAGATVERGINVTREVLHATVALARARGARPVILVPLFGGEDPAERDLRRRILDDTLPSLPVTVTGDWRLPWDRHPNAAADRAIATAVAAALESRRVP
jgi:hypothetical protein